MAIHQSKEFGNKDIFREEDNQFSPYGSTLFIDEEESKRP